MKDKQSLAHIFDHFKTRKEMITISSRKGSSWYKPTWQGLFDNSLKWYFIDTNQTTAAIHLHDKLCVKFNDTGYKNARTDEHVIQTWKHMTYSDKEGFLKKIGKPFDGNLEKLIRYFKEWEYKNNGTEKEWTYLFDNELGWFYTKNESSMLGYRCPETCQDVRDIWDRMEPCDKDEFFHDTMILGIGSKDMPI
jgi:hypothetical protein